MKSLIPRKSHGKQKPSTVASNKPRYNGLVYLAKHIYSMLSEEVKKELTNIIKKEGQLSAQ